MAGILLWSAISALWLPCYFARKQTNMSIQKTVPFYLADAAAFLLSVVISFQESRPFVAFIHITLIYGLTASAMVDYKQQIIPNDLLLRAAAAGCLYFVFLFFFARESFLPTLVQNELTALGVFAILFLIAVLSKGLGSGDVKLFTVLGFCSGYSVTVSTLFWGLFFSMIASIVLLIRKKKGRKDSIPFGPFILAGYVMTMAAMYWA